MYPLAHLFFTQKLFGFLDRPLALGSIFPDMIISSGLSWIKSHSLGCNLWQLFKDRNKNLQHFSLGVITHGVEPKGLDYYSDEKYKHYERGYCFEKAKPLIDKVIQACSLSREDGWWKAHNFIEMSVELYIYEKYPHLLTVLRETFADTSLIKEIIREVSVYLELESSLIEKSADLFSEFALKEPSDAYSLASRFQSQEYFKNSISAMDLEESREVIEEGRRLIYPDIEDFFAHVHQKILPLLKPISGI